MTHLKFLRPFISLFLALSLLTPSQLVYAEENPFKVSSELDVVLTKSLDQLYDLQFEDALETIETVRDQAEEHPIIAFAIASAHWWRLSVFVLEPDKKESKPFLKAAEEAIKIAEKKIKAGDETGEAHLVMGGVLGLWGRWEATNRNWLPAYFKGKKAYRFLRKSLEVNPKMYDAYMGLGIFDYYVATLPAVVRILAFLGMGGDKQKGLDELHIAAKKVVMPNSHPKCS